MLHQQLQHQILTRKGPYEVSELPARPSWGTTRPPEWPDRQLQLLHWLQLMLLLQCCARFLLHDQASARRRAGGRQRTAPTCCRASEIGGTATPRPAQRSRQLAWQASHPALYGTGGLYAYVPGMHKQVCSGTPDGVTATAPAETADCTRTAPAHPRESRITRAAEERLFRTCLDTASHPPTTWPFTKLRR